MIWLRAAVLSAIALILAVLAGRVFDGLQPELLVGAVLPAAAVLTVIGRHWLQVTAATIASIVISVALAVTLVDGRLPDDVVAAIVRGPRRLLSTDWPSPDRADLVGVVTLAIAFATCASLLLLRARLWRLAPLVPLLLLFVGISAASAPGGATTPWLVPLGLLAAFFATLEPDRPVGERLRIVAGERQLVVLSSIAVCLAALISVPVALHERADPRRDEPPRETRALVDPIQSVVAIRSIEPPLELHRIVVDDGRLPERWRTAALETYDGNRWSPVLTLRPIGRRLGADTSDAIDMRIEFLTDDLDLVPIAGQPITVETDVLTDDRRTVVRLVERPRPGDVADVTVEPAPARPAAPETPIATREVDEIAARFTDTAETIGGDGTLLERLEMIEATMRQEFTLDTDAPGAGLQRALIDRFLETRRGTREQFVTAFALLARSLGVDTRVATGFVAPDGLVASGGTALIGSDLAAVWPEVRVEGVGWIAFDPVPESEAANEEEPPPPPRAQAPPAVQPPAQSQEDRGEPPPEADPPPAPASTSRWTAVVTWTVRAVVITLLVLWPLVVAVALILWWKRRRRRHRLAAASPLDRIRGAWAVATDALIDAGLTIRVAWTDDEIASAGGLLAPPVRYEIRRLGRLSSSATFGGLVTRGQLLPEAPLLADDAVASVRRIEDVLATSRTRWQRWRWRLSLRSLRRGTRSPVLGEPPGAS